MRTTRPPARRGRPAGSVSSRQAILQAARDEFAAHGYHRATVRDIATAAGVDPAMISHHFGSKHGLFAASLELPIDPAVEIAAVLDGPPDRMAERVLTRFLQVWDGAAGSVMSSLIRTALQQPESLGQLREFVLDSVISPMLAHCAVDPVQRGWRGSLIASQMLGLIMARYVVRIEPLASADHPQVVAAVSPTLQRHLTGDLGGAVDDETSARG